MNKVKKLHKNILHSSKQSEQSKPTEQPEHAEKSEHREHREHIEKKEHKHKESTKTSDDDEVKIDFRKVKKVFSNNTILIVILLLIGIFFSVYFRSYPASLPIVNDWAANAAYNSIRSNVAAQINQQYPNLPAANKNELIDQQVDKILKEQGVQINEQIGATADYFRSRMQNDDGQTYLLAIDPYQHLRRAENLLKNGHLGDTIVDGNSYNTHRYAPIGTVITPDLHPFVIFYLYRILRIFNPLITMLAAAFWVPVLISALSVIPAFFLARRRAGLFGGFIAGLIVAIHPVFIGRTAGGFSDTDAYVVLFALLATWLFVEGFETNNLKKRIILAVLSSFVIGLFSFSWAGWWYIFDLIVGMVVLYIGYVILRILFKDKSLKAIFNSKSIRLALITLIVFVVCSAVFVPLMGPSSIKAAVEGPIIRSQLKVAAHGDFWPNIQTTVAELNPISIPGAINQLGGKMLFFVAAFGVILSLVKVDELRKKDYFFIGISFVYLLILLSKSLLNLRPITYLILLAIPIIIGFILLIKDDREIDIKYGILLILWFIGSMYASTKGTRFVLLLVPAFGIAMGISLGLVHRMLKKIISKEFKLNKIAVSVVLFVLLLFFMLAPLNAANAVSRNEVPSMNDAWWESLTRIKLNSSEDAIINSWWDFGHWFKYVADRPVTVDGSGQDYQLAHWMGTILISSDEDRAVNTLRMLDCGSRMTYITLRDDTEDILLAVNLTKTIIMQSEDEAVQTLKNAGVSQKAIDEAIGYSFCDPPENFLIASEDMVGKAGVWGHFGSWNFRRAYIYVTAKGERAEVAIPMIMKELGITEDQATDYYYEVQALTTEEEGNAWIAPWPNYFTNRWNGCTVVSNEDVLDAINEVNEEDNSTNSSTNSTSNTTTTTISTSSGSGKGVLVCNINKAIQSGGNQGNLILERAVIDLNDYENSTLIIGAYDPNSGYRTGGGESIPAAYVFFKEDEIERVKKEGVAFPFDILVDLVENRVLVSDPLLSESLFTKLFFLDGRYTEHFEKFSDLSTVTGQRVIVWKVKWD